MARAEYQGCPPGVVRGAAAHPSIASALNHTVRLPRRRRPASYAGQFVTLCVRLGMWWRRSWFSSKGKAGTPGSGQGQPPTPGRPRAPSSGSVHQGGVRAHPDADRREKKGADYRLGSALIELKALDDEGFVKPERQHKLAALF